MALWRSVATIGSLTSVSRVTGFLRDIAMTSIIGAGMVADCFVVAFKLPNFFRRLFAEGAFNAAFVPLFTEKLALDDGQEEARRFAEDSFAVLLVTLLAFVAFIQAIMPAFLFLLANGFTDDPPKFDLAVTLTRITFPYLLFISLVSLLGGVLNALDRFAAVAATPILLNLSLIGCLFLLEPVLPTGGHALAIGVTFGGFLQFAWLAFEVRRAGFRIRLRRPRLTPGVKRLLILMAPVALGAGAVQLNLLIDVVIASFLPDGSMSYLFYADRLNQLPVGVVGVAVGTALLPLLSRQINAGDDRDSMASLNRAIEICLFLTLPAAVALFLVPGPLVATLFERGAFNAADTAATAAALAAYAAGLPAYVLVKVLGPAFFARQDTKTPVKLSIIALVVNTALNLILMGPFLHVGLAMATAIAAWLNVAMMAFVLMRRGHLAMDSRLKSRLPRLCLTTAAMGGLVWFMAPRISVWSGAAELDRIGAAALLVGAGALTFAVLAQLTGALRVHELRSLIRGQQS
ncbi:MAG: murein biosynthesis integral membrane protein MurJ [Alphaproteobacteria bacterium]